MHAHDRQKLRVMYSGIQCVVHGDVPNICSHATYPQTLAFREIVQIQRISRNLEQPSCSSSLLGCTLCSNIKFGTEKVRRRNQGRVKIRRKSPKPLHPTPWLSPRPAVVAPGSGYTAAGKHQSRTSSHTSQPTITIIVVVRQHVCDDARHILSDYDTANIPVSQVVDMFLLSMHLSSPFKKNELFSISDLIFFFFTAEKVCTH